MTDIPVFNGKTYDPADYTGADGRGYNATVTTGTGEQFPRYIAAMVDALADLANNAQTTSASPITIGQGSPFTATLDMHIPTLENAYVLFVDSANSANFFYGEVATYDPVNKIVTGTQERVGGSGAISSWKVQQRVGQPGIDGANGAPGDPGSIASMVQVNRSSNTILGASDSGKQITATSSFTQTCDTPANIGTGWWVFYKNKSSGLVTLNFVIDGYQTTILQPDDAIGISCNGTSRRRIWFTPGNPYLHAGASLYLANHFT